MKREIYEKSMTESVRDDIYRGFASHAVTTVGMNGLDQAPVLFEMKCQKISVGVCVAQIFWGQLHFKNLLVFESFRKKGVGRDLVEHACEWGRQKGATFAFVETMNFQGPDFYQKLGFEIDFVRYGYTAGTSFYYLKKML